jgi:hypothetical protein
MRLAQKKFELTDKELVLRFAGPKNWQFIVLFVLLGPLIGGLITLAWVFAGKIKKKRVKLANVKSVEVDHPKFTLVHRIKLTVKNDEMYYFIPRKSYWQMLPNKEFVNETARQIKKLAGG